MSVIVLDSSEEDGNQNEAPEASAKPADKAPEQQPQAAPPPADDLPEKFRGKSPSDIARAYKELESHLGRQAQEIGELRRTHDEFIRSTLAQRQASQPAKDQPEQDDDSEFFVNPRQAIKKLLQEDEVIRELRQVSAETQMDRARRLLQSKHPDSPQLVQDPAFVEWVNKSPVRAAMLMHAHQNYDVAAADELFTTWKEIKGTKAAAAQGAADAARETQRQAGVMPTGNAAPETSGGKKTYRRVDLVRMMMNDPDRYASMNDEILAAYAEGRVK